MFVRRLLSKGQDKKKKKQTSTTNNNPALKYFPSFREVDLKHVIPYAFGSYLQGHLWLLTLNQGLIQCITKNPPLLKKKVKMQHVKFFRSVKNNKNQSNIVSLTLQYSSLLIALKNAELSL